MSSGYVEPELSDAAVSVFTCPNCGALTGHEWSSVYRHPRVKGVANSAYTRTFITRCQNAKCRKDALWLDGRVVDPDSANAPLPNPDLPDDVRATYDEASRVLSRSRRAAGALLRLSIQQLVIALGQPGKDLNSDIGELVKKGLPVGVQQALDVVRVIGNNSVHPGTIIVDEEPGVIESLFKLVNLIAEKLISEPLELAELYEGLPEGARDQIERRDTDS